MAKKVRTLLKDFGGKGDSKFFHKFGGFEAKDSLPTKPKDVEELQNLEAFTEGWQRACCKGSKLPAMEEMNSLFYLFGHFIKYLYQEGVPEWNVEETYYLNSIVKHDGFLYKMIFKTDEGIKGKIPGVEGATDYWAELSFKNLVAERLSSFSGSSVPYGDAGFELTKEDSSGTAKPALNLYAGSNDYMHFDNNTLQKVRGSETPQASWDDVIKAANNVSKGIPEWNDTETYYKDSIVKYNGFLYKAVYDGREGFRGQEPSKAGATAYWAELSFKNLVAENFSVTKEITTNSIYGKYISIKNSNAQIVDISNSGIELTTDSTNSVTRYSKTTIENYGVNIKDSSNGKYLELRADGFIAHDPAQFPNGIIADPVIIARVSHANNPVPSTSTNWTYILTGDILITDPITVSSTWADKKRGDSVRVNLDSLGKAYLVNTTSGYADCVVLSSWVVPLVDGGAGYQHLVKCRKGSRQ